ncbi:hypothetical protein [Dactylosporangium sp. NPDC049140]
MRTLPVLVAAPAVGSVAGVAALTLSLACLVALTRVRARKAGASPAGV